MYGYYTGFIRNGGGSPVDSRQENPGACADWQLLIATAGRQSIVRRKGLRKLTQSDSGGGD